MEYFIPIFVCIVVFFSVFGAPLFLYWAIRALMGKQVRKGLLMLAGSFVMGFVVFLKIAAVIGAKDHAQMAGCSSRLKQMMLFLKMYASDHQEKYPLTFNDMVATNYLRPGDASILVCPASQPKASVLENIHSWTDYAYVSGLTDEDPMDCVVAFCPPENHKGRGATVAFVGGQVRWFSCRSHTNASSECYEPSFHDLTNTPSLFYGTTNEVELADLKKRTRIIWPKRQP